jgi:cysteinyl-tRNA synthetase
MHMVMNRKTAVALPCLLLLLVLLGSCGPVPLKRLGGYQSIPCRDAAQGGAPVAAAGSLAALSWLYQLQGADPAQIDPTAFDMAVIDYSRSGEESGRYNSADMAALRSGGRQVIAYLSIGEAEAYRYYFDAGWIDPLTRQPDSSAPCWLGRTNPDWEGNYKVQYWSEDWQRIVLGYLDRIIADGFDGVYLDIVDAFEYWGDPDSGEGYHLSEPEAARRMIELVKRIAHQARVERGQAGFHVVPQNGERILDYDLAGDYLQVVSGLGVEDLYYDGTSPIPAAQTAARKAYLNQVTGLGKPVLVVDYVDGGSRPPASIVTDFRAKAVAVGFVPYAARSDRELDEINTFAGQP